ncbi:MAG: repressor LexA [SAR202 cluster bacterium]|nr:repressor LexA [Chloroflexota bacterium]MQG88930.1 repressor LexA [SAR202 cluster bacterium]|tara:strand:+ start:1498 stop:2181 length:684 start_codon:yes stop_codon:yes gene_type:complete
MKKLSEKQELILSFIQDFIYENDYPPTIRDIQNGCNISSTSVVSYNLDRLKENGHLNRHSEVSRGLSLANPKDSLGWISSEYSHSETTEIETVAVPLLGTIAAGAPFPMPENDTWSDLSGSELIDLPQAITGTGDGLYALKVRGESMIDALISDGDLVIMEQSNSVRNGQMAAVRIKSDNTTTLKHFYSEGRRTRLEPANPQMKAMTFESNEIEVLSRVVAVWRYMG